MKLVKGKTLARLLAEREGPAEDRLRFLGIFEQVCQPIAYAHARGVIHRDLKPSNVMVGAFGEVQVMDWGLAKVLERGGIADDRLSRTSQSEVSVIETVRSGSSSHGSLAGSVLGTPAYMAPEQARGEVEDLDGRTDVFGLGAILCEILTGQPPYVATTVKEVQRLAKKGYLEDANERLERCGADREVIELAKRCLAFEPRDRPPDARAVARRIRSYLESLEERARRTELRAARTKSRAVSAGLFIFALGVAGMSYLWVDRERQEVAAEAALRLERAVSDARVAMAEAASDDSSSPEWSGALEAVENAEELVTPQIAPDVREELARLRRQVDREVRTHELITSLEEIRDATGLEVMSFTKDASYSNAFKEFFGSDIFDVPSDVAVEQIRQTKATAEILHALEEWALIRRALPRPWESLRDIALALDPAPSRERMWEILAGPDPAAVDGFLESLEEDKVSTDLLCVLAKKLSYEQHVGTPEKVLRRVLDFEPGHVQANFQLGRLLSRPHLGRKTEGITFITVARALHPRSTWIRFTLAWELGKAGYHDQALEECAKLIEEFQLVGYEYCILYRIALNLLDGTDASFSQKALDRFLAALEKALASRRVPTLRRMWEPLGAARVLRYTGEDSSDVLAKARSDVQRAGRHDPYALNMLARVLFATGHREEAIRTLEEAIALPEGSPTWPRLLRNWRRDLLPALVSYGSIDAALRPTETIVAEGAEWRYFRGTELPSEGLEWTRMRFDGPNAIQLDPDDEEPIRVNVPAGRYSALHFALVSAWGSAELPVTLVYSDGETEHRELHSHDWYEDPGASPISLIWGGDLLTAETTPLINGMDRLNMGRFENTNDPALFETSLRVDPRRKLVAFRLEPAQKKLDHEKTRISIFAVTGVWTGEVE